MKDYSVDRGPDELEPFFPHEVMREALYSLMLVALMLAMIILLPEGSQEPREGEAIDHPSETLWFFWPLFKLHRLTESWTVTWIVLVAGGLFVLAVPFLERTRELSIGKRPFSLAIALVLLAGLLWAVAARFLQGFV